MTMDIKIIVATHKKYWMPQDPVYYPLHVGREGKQDLGYSCDNTGENISVQNPHFCELTGLYWAWKNLQCDYIGLCHYRRYFAKPEWVWARNGEAMHSYVLSSRDYHKYVQKYDVLIPIKMDLEESVAEQYVNLHKREDLEHLAKIVKTFYPDYSDAWDKVMNARKMSIANMFVMSKSNFDSYCTWLFKCLFTLEQQIDISHYNTYQARIYGFLGERLLNVWLEKQNLRTLELPMAGFEDEYKWHLEKRLRYYWRYKKQEFLSR